MHPVLTGQRIVRLMRINKVTIRELARRSGITQRRIREVRASGIKTCLNTKRDWLQAITGQDPGPQSWFS